MPKLWSDTIDAHRRAVHAAILDAAWALAAEHGVLSVTMSQVAERAGVGRATLYKYFHDVEAILVAHHHRHVAEHLQQLAEVRRHHAQAGERLVALLRLYAGICHRRGRHGSVDLDALLHREQHVADSRRQLADLFREVLAEAGEVGQVRRDVPAEELATYCLRALEAAGELPSEDAVDRLVAVTLAGLK
ncbi:TetR/AcrR family transcriptional regulator [Kribbella sp. DT2]|uniref:TetR/AcrR family transcriptional regulator n=1 Tax=Kribbella sp. DT2 TaxID=3393427 RepID=UPI003CFAD628